MYHLPRFVDLALPVYSRLHVYEFIFPSIQADFLKLFINDLISIFTYIKALTRKYLKIVSKISNLS